MLSLWCVFVLTLQGGAASISAPIIYSSVVAFGAVTDTRDFALNIRLSFLRLLSVCSVFHPRALDFFFFMVASKDIFNLSPSRPVEIRNNCSRMPPSLYCSHGFLLKPFTNQVDVNTHFNFCFFKDYLRASTFITGSPT